MTLVRALKDKNMHCTIKQIRKSPDKCVDVSGRWWKDPYGSKDNLTHTQQKTYWNLSYWNVKITEHILLFHYSNGFYLQKQMKDIWMGGLWPQRWLLPVVRQPALFPVSEALAPGCCEVSDLQSSRSRVTISMCFWDNAEKNETTGKARLFSFNTFLLWGRLKTMKAPLKWPSLHIQDSCHSRTSRWKGLWMVYQGAAVYLLFFMAYRTPTVSKENLFTDFPVSVHSGLKMDNSTDCNKSDDFKYNLYASVFSMVFVVGLAFNAVAVYIFGCTLKIRNETTTYMMNLVVSDSLFVLSLPFRIVYFIRRDWLFGSALCKISVALFYTNMYGSILFLTCISVDRFLAIVYPFRSQTIRTRKNAKLACLTVWVIILSGGITTGVLLDTTSPNNTNSSSVNSTPHFCFENYSKTQWKAELSWVVMFIETAGFLIPLMLNVFCSVMVLRILRNPKTISRGGNLNKAKILRMVFVHLLIFCFCFIPYNVNLIFYTLVRSKILMGCFAEHVVRTIYPIALCIAVTNCCFDPVVYYFTSEAIQSSIKRKSSAWQNGARLFERLQMDSSQSSPSLTLKSLTLKSQRPKIFDNESTV